ncbi:MAG TPA: hypothetical protein VFJ22_12870 [Dermatophilaceae bacterium]|nr:hypothetical protein [Dermatophilaceae bacterium]
MTTQAPGNKRGESDSPPRPQDGSLSRQQAHQSHDRTHARDRHDMARLWRHRLLMIACCIPMLVLVIALVASGAAGSGALLFALICIGLMGLMMFMIPGGRDH